MGKDVIKKAKKRNMESIGRLRSNRNISIDNKLARSLCLHTRYLLSKKRRIDQGFKPLSIKDDERKTKKFWVHETKRSRINITSSLSFLSIPIWP